MSIVNSYIFRQSVISLMVFYLLCLNSIADAKEYYQLIKKFSVQDGMVSNGILKMVKDVRGFYWFASPEGLCRFDGNRFMSFYYNKLNDKSLSNNWVTDLVTDHKGVIWIGTREGICKIDPYTLVITRIPVKDQQGNKAVLFVNDLALSANGEIYAATGNGIYQIDTTHAYATTYSIEDINYEGNRDNLFSLEMDRTDRMYISYGSKLQIVDHHKIVAEHFMKEEDVLDKIYWDKNEVLLLKSYNGKIFRLDTRLNKVGIDTYLSKQYSFNGIQYDPSIDALLYTTRNGLFGKGYASDSVFTLINWDNRLQFSDKAGVMFIQAEGRKLWVSTTAGLYLWEKRGSGIETHEFMNQLAKDRRNEFAEISEFNRRGDCWISLIDSGLIKYNKYTRKVLPLSISLRKILINTISINQIINLNDSALLFINELQVIYFNKNTEKAAHFKEVIGYEIMKPVYTLLMQGDSVLWYSNAMGLHRYEIKSHRNIKIIPKINDIPPGYYSNKIFQIIIDINHILWCIAEQHPQQHTFVGRILPNEDSMTLYFNKPDNMDALNTISSFEHIESRFDDLIWVSTNEGLIYWKSTEKEINPVYITKEQGLASYYTRDLVISNKGIIWIATTNGVIKYDYLAHSISKYLDSDGLFENNSWRIFYIDNKICLPYNGAISFIDPIEIEKNIVPVSYGVSNVIVNGVYKPLNTNNTLVLQYNENQITFDICKEIGDYTGSFYKYKLLPLDLDWNSTNSAEINYHNLAPGKYNFEILFGSSLNSFGFDILAPFWQTWWFKSIIILSVLFLIWYYITIREKTIRDKYKLRQKISSDLHDDIGSTLTSINILSNVYDTIADDAPDDAKKLVKNIAAQSKAMQQSMSDIVWAIRPDNERINDLLGRMREYTGDTLDKLDIKVDYQLDLIDGMKLLPMEFRKDFLLLFKEAINNIAKHAHATAVTILLSQREKYLKLIVGDNGTWTGTERSSGLGTSSMEIRAKKMNGTLDIIPSGTGTRVEVTIPIP